MSSLSLAVNNRLFRGWKSIQLERTIESLAGSFALEVNDRWVGQSNPWPVYEEDPCRVLIDDETVLDGYVDRRRVSFGPNTDELAFSGRSKSAALVDCSAILDKWTFRNATVVDIAEKVAAPFGIAVVVQPGLQLKKAPPKMVVNPGDTAWTVISAAAKEAGVIVVGLGNGSIMITRSGTTRATTALVEGENIISAEGNFDASNRYHRYIVATQAAGTDNASGGATRISGEAIDESVIRTARELMVRPSGGMSKEYARQLADWEARTRAARGDSVRVKVHRWRQGDGTLWPINAIVPVKSPKLGIDGDMLISRALHVAGSGGETTTLSLVRPDAFTPAPSARVKPHKSKESR